MRTNNSIMETSTPIRNTNNIRSKETPLRKRISILAERNENDKIWKSNDLNERDNRRASIVARKSILPRNVDIDGSPGLNDSIRILSEKDIKSQLLICSKLNAENKINADNAWKLKVIDLLNQFIRKDNPDVLKVAGSSLEVAGKVYGIRVDDLHSAGLKLASTLARTIDKKSTQQDDNEDADIPENEPGQVQKKKKQKKRRSLLCEDKKHTISSNTKTFKEPLPKLESCAFSAKIDNSVSATDNLFTNNMRTDNAGYRFIFLDETKYFAWTPNSDLSVKPEKIAIETEDIPTTFQICAPFKDFDVDIWDPDEEMDLGRKSLNSQEVILDDNGIPIAELDGSIHDVFQEIIEDDVINCDEGFEQEVILPPLLQEKDTLLDFQPSNQLLVNSVQKSEYSYNSVVGTCSGKIDQIWAGPSHWKMKHVKRPRPLVYTGQDKQQDKEKKRGPRKKIEPVLLDFTEFDEPIKTFKLMKKKKLPKEISEDKITFPLFHSVCKEMIDHLEELLLVPLMKPVCKDETQIDCEVAEYKFDNPNDSNYIPNHLVDGHQPDLADDIFGDEPDNFDECGRGDFMDDNLIGVPEMVAQSDMHYAIRAKKMDMKKLKSAVWEILTNRDSYDVSAKVIETSFSLMYKNLPERLNENMKKELSCPIAFVALLHLCNEQNLTLKKAADISDFGIRGPS
ncbi:non-SMC condensin I complex subunit H [Rhynchophorus ferrugineus]|uniref:non-SMC condensin I complex subunit H n=1 Tax=Rhynchophorus ferrugineus TaxID=354439 RepID=UPI003FCCA505